MINIFIKTDSHYIVNRKRIRETINRYFNEKKIKGILEISVNVVGDRLMRLLNKKYRNLDQTTDVLAFPLSNGTNFNPFVDPPDGILRLGDIVLSYPQIIDDAIEENKLVEEKIDQLLMHGLDHLLGNHREI